MPPQYFSLFFLLSLTTTTRASSLYPPHSLLVESLVFPEGVESSPQSPPRFSWSLSPLSPSARSLQQSAYELTISYPGMNWSSSMVSSNSTSLVTPEPSTFPALPPSSLITWSVRVWDTDSSDPTPFSAPATFTTGVALWGGEWVHGVGGNENIFRAALPLPPLSSGVSVSLAVLHVAGVGSHAVTLNGAPASTTYPERKLDGGWTSFAKKVLYTTYDLTEGLNNQRKAMALQGGDQTFSVIGVSLGNSWYNSAGWYAQPPYGWPSATNGGGFSYTSPPLMRAQARLLLSNGTELHLASSASPSSPSPWQWQGARGPITFDSLYDGETYNGSRATELGGWDTPEGYAPSSTPTLLGVVGKGGGGGGGLGWAPVVSAAASGLPFPIANTTLSWQPFEPTVRTAAFPPLTSYQPSPGVTVYDCGSNGVGVVRWTFRGLPPGTNVTLRYAEVATHPPYGPANGALYFDNLRNAHATDFFSSDGQGGVEVFEPRFSWHGFRYAQLSSSGSSSEFTPPPLQDLLCIRQGNALAPGASVAFGDTTTSTPTSTLGVVHALATNTMVGSFQGGPGSCGGRDERQFFTGDTQTTAVAAMTHFRGRALYASWAANGLTDQNPDGSIGYYLPTPITDHRDGSPQWSTGFLTVTWALGALEGDLGTAALLYPAVNRYLNFNEGVYAAAAAQPACAGGGGGGGGGMRCFPGTWPSEWQESGGVTPNPSCFNALAYIKDLSMGVDVATWVEGEGGGRAGELAALLANRTAAFHQAWFNASTGVYGAGSQSELALALWLRIPPTPAITASVFAALVDTVVEGEGTTPRQLTGIVGTRYLYGVLGRYGRGDLVGAILSTTSYPSFGFMAGLGGGGSNSSSGGVVNPEPSSTLWEIWKAYEGEPIMSSRNHLMFSGYSEGLLDLGVGVSLRGMGGIQGVLVSPTGLSIPPPSSSNGTTLFTLPFASGSYTTPRGVVGVSWAVGGGPSPIPSQTCGAVEEVGTVVINCTGRGVVSDLLFASFGTPSGDCGGPTPFAVDPQCSSQPNTTHAFIASACLGKVGCEVVADFHTFGDPCEGVKKRLAINVSCTTPPPPTPPPSWADWLFPYPWGWAGQG